MKIINFLAIFLLIAVVAVQADDKHSLRKFMASSKTFVTTEPGLHRFCIPIGKAAIGSPKSLSLHIPRAAHGFSVRLDTQPDSVLASPPSSSDKHCKKVSSLFLVKDFHPSSNFHYSGSEVEKSGTISGYIVGDKPEWITVRLGAAAMKDVDHASDVCQSVLGVKSESAFSHDDKNHQSGPKISTLLHVLNALRLTTFMLSVAALVVCVIVVLRKCVTRCKAKKALDNVEMAAVPSSAEDQEARDVLLAVQASLEDQKKNVVEVPQTAAPQFVFVPPQMMPAMAPGGASTPYVPMFAPQFMNYSLGDRQ